MATAFVQANGAQVASGTSVGVTLSGVGAGHHLNVSGSSNIATLLTTATSSPSATWANAFSFVGSGQALRMDYSENVASGSWTVTVHGSSGELSAEIAESSGVATSSSLGAVNHGSSASASAIATGSITPASGSILYTSTTDNTGQTTPDTIDNSFSVIVSTGFTNDTWNGSNQRLGLAHKDNVAASAINPTWTLPGGGPVPIAAGIAEFKAAAGGAAPPPMGQSLDIPLRLPRAIPEMQSAPRQALTSVRPPYPQAISIDVPIWTNRRIPELLSGPLPPASFPRPPQPPSVDVPPRVPRPIPELLSGPLPTAGPKPPPPPAIDLPPRIPRAIPELLSGIFPAASLPRPPNPLSIDTPPRIPRLVPEMQGMPIVLAVFGAMPPHPIFWEMPPAQAQRLKDLNYFSSAAIYAVAAGGPGGIPLLALVGVGM
jgi:hypothetical protein